MGAMGGLTAAAKMGNGVGKDNRRASSFTPSLPNDAGALSDSMRAEIEKGMTQDREISAENQGFLREDRVEDRAMRDKAFADETQYTKEDRAKRDDALSMFNRMLTSGAGSASSEKTLGPLDDLIAQIGDAIKTGGVGAQIPIINRAVEDSRAGTANALKQLDDRFGASRTGGTPYAERTRADTLLSGEHATAGIPTDIAKKFIEMGGSILPNVEANRASMARGRESELLRIIAQIVSGGAVAPSPQQLVGFSSAPGAMLNLGGAGASLVQSGTSRANVGATTAAQRDIAEWMASAQMYGDTTKAVTGVASSAAGGCWVAHAIYGPGIEWLLARHYIFEVWQGRMANATRAVYQRVGPRLARHRRLCLMLKPLFDVAVRRGRAAWFR